ncbi:MAG: hypothetical protein HRT44_02025, partial [Bdellovibrionales bacterium]|nr:hypothetical protein [Bdellovibrionales bacterium]NQZ18024.1 hypothetical protein [Bdellovibrionales bacterium]
TEGNETSTPSVETPTTEVVAQPETPVVTENLPTTIMRPDTGFTLSAADGDFNRFTVQQVITIGYPIQASRVLVEMRYFLVDELNNQVRPRGCEVFFYRNDERSLEKIAIDSDLTIEDVIFTMATGHGVAQFGGEYNPGVSWFFQNTFINNQESCSNSIAGSGIIDSVNNGPGEIIYQVQSQNVMNRMSTLPTTR